VRHGERGAQERFGWVHIEKGLQVKDITMINKERGIQWGRSQIRGVGGSQYHREKTRLKKDRHYYD